LHAQSKASNVGYETTPHDGRFLFTSLSDKTATMNMPTRNPAALEYPCQQVGEVSACILIRVASAGL
jgi:hypothetical protein